MAEIVIDGVKVAYEVIGEAGPGLAITPGGRFSKDEPGVRELAVELAKGGRRVLIWDRPNTGESDVCFTGVSESAMHADTLAALLRALDLAPAVISGGSGGSRVSLLTALRHPDVAEQLVMWWISGGIYGLMVLANHYCGTNYLTARRFGMAAVADLPEWAEVVARNPSNRDRFLAQDPDEFAATMERWMASFIPYEGVVVPGATPEDYERLATIPVLIFRSGASDPHHTRRTSEQLHELIPGSRLVEPPWPDDEWNQRSVASAAGTGRLFERWPLLAPQILEFVGRGR